jgi:hypothetical protein
VGNLQTALKIVSILKTVPKLAAILHELEGEIKAAVPGEVVIGPTVKGLKLFGREVDLPLKPHVVK